MSHLVPVRDYSGASDPLAAIHAARLERQRRLAASAYVPPKATQQKVETETAPKPALPVEDVLARYKLAVDTFDPIVNMEGLSQIRAPRPAWPAVLAVVTRETGVIRIDIESRRRFKKIARARQLAFWMMRSCTKLSLPIIGRIAGDFDHTTVLHGCHLIDRLRSNDPQFCADTARMRDELIGLLK